MNLKQIQWQKLMLKICVWLLIEAIFSVIGIDDLVDYSEFLWMPKTVLTSNRSILV